MTLNFVTPTEAVDYLRRGRVLLVPTETVVGLVATADGLERIQEIKGRDPSKPIALLCRDADEAFSLAKTVPNIARRLAELYWPGPLTLVLEARGSGTVGLRVPLGTVREVLDAYGGPLYATSANLSGEPAPESLVQVDAKVSEIVDAVVQGEGGGGEASAVIDVSGEEPKVLRPGGALDEERLREIVRMAKR